MNRIRSCATSRCITSSIGLILSATALKSDATSISSSTPVGDHGTVSNTTTSTTHVEGVRGSDGEVHPHMGATTVVSSAHTTINTAVEMVYERAGGSEWRFDIPNELKDARSLIRCEIVERLLNGTIPSTNTTTPATTTATPPANTNIGLLDEMQIIHVSRLVEAYLSDSPATSTIRTEHLASIFMGGPTRMYVGKTGGLSVQQYFTIVEGGGTNGGGDDGDVSSSSAPPHSSSSEYYTELELVNCGISFVVAHLALVESPEYLMASTVAGDLAWMWKLVREHASTSTSTHGDNDQHQSKAASHLDDQDSAILEEELLLMGGKKATNNTTTDDATTTVASPRGSRRPTSVERNPDYLIPIIASATVVSNRDLAVKSKGAKSTADHTKRIPQFVVSRMMSEINADLDDVKAELQLLESKVLAEEKFAEDEAEVLAREAHLEAIKSRIRDLAPTRYVGVWESFFSFLVANWSSFEDGTRWLNTYVSFTKKHRGSIEDLVQKYTAITSTSSGNVDASTNQGTSTGFDEAALFFDDLGADMTTTTTQTSKSTTSSDAAPIITPPIVTTGGILPIGIVKCLASIAAQTHSFHGGLDLLGRVASIASSDVREYERLKARYGDGCPRTGAGYVYANNDHHLSGDIGPVMPKPTKGDTHHILAMIGYSQRFVSNASDGGFKSRTLQRIIGDYEQEGDKAGESTHRFLKGTSWTLLTFLLSSMSFESALTLIQLKAALIQIEHDAGIAPLKRGESAVPCYVWMNMLRYASKQYRNAEVDGMYKQILAIWRRETLAVTDVMGGSDEEDLGLSDNKNNKDGQQPTPFDRKEYLQDIRQLSQLWSHVETVLGDIVICSSYAASVYQPSRSSPTIESPTEKNYACAADVLVNKLTLETHFHTDALKEEVLRIHHKHNPIPTPMSNKVLQMKLGNIEQLEKSTLDTARTRLSAFLDTSNASALGFLEMVDAGMSIGRNVLPQEGDGMVGGDESIEDASSATDRFNTLFGANASFARLSADVPDADDYSELDSGLLVPANMDASVAREQVKTKKDLYHEERRSQESAYRKRIEQAQEEDARKKHEKLMAAAKLKAASIVASSKKKALKKEESMPGQPRHQHSNNKSRGKSSGGSSSRRESQQLKTEGATLRFSDRHRSQK